VIDRRALRADPAGVRPERLAELFIDVSWQLGRLSSRARTGELSNARYNVMRAVLDQGPERMSRIASVIGISPRSLTDLVDALVKDGYLHRQTDPHDRRSVLIELTASGHEVVRAGRRARLGQAAHVFQDLDTSERANLEGLLIKLGRRHPARADVS
jgi:DNA-binding MarR family transcriptional regulator